LVGYVVFAVLWPGRNEIDPVQQTLPTHWYEYLERVFAYSLLPAIIAVAVGFKKKIKHWWIVYLVALPAGLLTAVGTWYSETFTHIDCGATCSGDVLSFGGIRVLMILIMAIWFALPMVWLIFASTKE